MKSGYEAQLQPLFAAAIAGERKAYHALLSQIGLIARNYINRKTGGQGGAEDVVQEILISVHKALHTYDPARPCMPWLAAIMHYRLSDWLRKRYHASEQPKVPLEEVEEFLCTDVTEEPFAYEHLHKAIKDLPEGQRAVLHAMYQQELTVTEAGAALGMSVSAVKVTAHRAYKKLRAKLEDQ